MRRALQLYATCAALLALAGCSEPAQPVHVPKRDFEDFAGFVLPVLLRDCGFQACHGSQDRFFRVYGAGRARLIPGTGALADTNATEVEYSYQLAVSMIDADDPAESLLLRKPLAEEAGGASHEGVDKYGRNVYRTPDDDGYLQLAQWVYADDPSQAAAGSSAPVVPAAGSVAPPPTAAG
ncbi:MAG TPA: hypothetical protein VJR89_19045, partial [Polyangiales bacterium]|nr:hypothetical protein [Polyangiales bacterium]